MRSRSAGRTVLCSEADGIAQREGESDATRLRSAVGGGHHCGPGRRSSRSRRAQAGLRRTGGWSLSTIDDFVGFAIGEGWPVDLTHVIRAALEGYDNNDDGSICWKPFRPVETGAFPPGVFNIVDNVVVQR